MRSRDVAILVVCIALALSAGCSRSVPPPPPRTTDEIFHEQMELPAVYLTPSGKRIVAPSGRGPFVDQQSREIAWPALACNRPDCPAASGADEPLLFISPDPALYAGKDGKIAFDPQRALAPVPYAGQCPECWKQRDPSTETAAQQQQFRDWAAPYVLPETAKRLAELEVERKRRVRRDRHQAIASE